MSLGRKRIKTEDVRKCNRNTQVLKTCDGVPMGWTSRRVGLTCFGRNFYCVASTDANGTTSDRTSIAMRSTPVRSAQGFRLEGVLHGRHI